MYNKSRWLVAIVVILFSRLGIAADPSYEAISRCFFVYAPIFETGKKLQNQPIFLYGQKRLSWAGGYVQAQQNNPAFKSIFENNLAANKKAGIAIENRLTKAVRTGSVDEYQAIMDVARKCDQQLGLPSHDIPHP